MRFFLERTHTPMNEAQIAVAISKWMILDDEIKAHAADLAALRKQHAQLAQRVLEHMRTHATTTLRPVGTSDVLECRVQKRTAPLKLEHVVAELARLGFGDAQTQRFLDTMHARRPVAVNRALVRTKKL